ncbi:MAG: agmatinase [Bacteroidetes bacterium]|nr:MAG: agmatinase [Bacteroidota bacterium]
MENINFDPNSPAVSDTIYGLPFDYKNAEIIILPVNWDVTVSYKEGTYLAPGRIKQASTQVDLFELLVPNAWLAGAYMLDENPDIIETNKIYREKAKKIIKQFETGAQINKELLNEINQKCAELNEWVYQQAKKIINEGKIVALLGGDHSTPFGYLKALSEKHEKFGILQIDAHADLRDSYEGFTCSHASIMYNVIHEIPQVSKLVQVGVRDLCEEEYRIIHKNNKIIPFFDYHIQSMKFCGKTWDFIVDEIISSLPEKVYISFDVDGLSPDLCPNTGTPVPGGLSFNEITYLFQKLVDSDKQIIGFDLVETGISENEWDENVSARLLYKLCAFTAKSLGKV